MNNNQFRRLVLDMPGQQNEGAFNGKVTTAPSTLGAKKSSFMPVTPRTVKGGTDVDFARQVRERNAALQPTKKFKSVAPKGVKYGAAYTDRARARAEAQDGDDEKAERIQSLEEQMKLGQLSVETFEALRDEITGGDVGSTHLVKGLDRKLLERVRRGEDVLGVGGGDAASSEPQPDVDDELDKLGDKEVEAVKREKVKKGTMAVAGRKRTRDEIMAELRAQRQAAAEAKAVPALDGRWKRLGEKEKSRIEVDHKGREVLITVDGDGNVRKKVRKIPAQGQEQDSEKAVLDMPDASKPVLGADVAVPEIQNPPVDEEEDDDDIFEGVGTEYNPLGNDNDDDDENDGSEDELESNSKLKPTKSEPPSLPREPTLQSTEREKSPAQKPMAPPRNYFKDTTSATDEPSHDRLAGVQDLLRKAAKMDPERSEHHNDESGEDKETREARLKKRAQMLTQQDRDLEDMDMGFGGSRYDDGEEEEGEGKKARLSEWKGFDGGDDGWEEREKGGGKKKRKPKKREGDVNNADDVMRVIEGRKAAAAK